MKKINVAWGVAVFGIMGLLYMGTAFGQSRRPPLKGNQVRAKQASGRIKIRRFSATGSSGELKTPVFRTNVSSGGGRRIGIWAVITTDYSTTEEWTDELVFQYYVLSTTKESGQLLYSLYKRIVRYVDIEKGANHLSTVFLRPQTLKRYGSVVAAAVEITVEGQVVAREEDRTGGVRLPAGEWWNNPAVLNDKALTVRDGLLLNRQETPFALVNIDDYEVIQ